MNKDLSYWIDITYRCYRKYERLIDLLAIKLDKKNQPIMINLEV